VRSAGATSFAVLAARPPCDRLLIPVSAHLVDRVDADVEATVQAWRPVLSANDL